MTSTPFVKRLPETSALPFVAEYVFLSDGWGRDRATSGRFRRATRTAPINTVMHVIREAEQASTA